MAKSKTPGHEISDELAQNARSIQFNGRLFFPVPSELARRLARENGGFVPSYVELAERVAGPADEGLRVTAETIKTLIDALRSGCNSFGDGDTPGWAQKQYERRAREILAALGAAAGCLPEDEGKERDER